MGSAPPPTSTLPAGGDGSSGCPHESPHDDSYSQLAATSAGPAGASTGRGVDAEALERRYAELRDEMLHALLAALEQDEEGEPPPSSSPSSSSSSSSSRLLPRAAAQRKVRWAPGAVVHEIEAVGRGKPVPR
jgi:hypothetical protein